MRYFAKLLWTLIIISLFYMCVCGQSRGEVEGGTAGYNIRASQDGIQSERTVANTSGTCQHRQRRLQVRSSGLVLEMSP